MILTWGGANRGKSQSLKRLALSIPFASILKPWRSDAYDSYVIGTVIDRDEKERRVGVVSLGDPGSCHLDWINECSNYNCDVIVAACRSYGATYGNAYDIAQDNGYEVIEVTTLFHKGGSALPNGVDLKDVFSENLKYLIMECLK